MTPSITPRRLRTTAILAVVLLVLAACKTSQPTVVPTPAATAAPTATPLPEPGVTAEPASTAAPAASLPIKGKAIYRHPSAAFSVRPFAALVEEGSDYALFADDTSVIMAFFGEREGKLTSRNVTTVAGELLQRFLVER